MYEDWYKLTDKPFQISTDLKFLWLGPKHKEALATLKYGVLDAKGFILLTGDVGTGKTTLTNSLVQSLGDTVQCAVVPDPRLKQMELFNYLATAFNLKRKFQSRGAFLEVFGNFLRQVHEQGKKTLLVIDEAQALTSDLMEDILLLSDLEKHSTKLLKIFFTGQNEFKNTLKEKAALALKQRIALSYDLKPLTLEETAIYISHRLKVAGASEAIFRRDAVKEIYGFAQGYPRLTNIICDHALLTGFVKELRTIGAGTVRGCTIELIMAFPSDGDNIDQIPVDLAGSLEPNGTGRQTAPTAKLKGSRCESRKKGHAIVGGKTPSPPVRREDWKLKAREVNQQKVVKTKPIPSMPATLQKPRVESQKSSVKHVQIVYSRGKKKKTAPKVATSETDPPTSRERDASQFQNTDLAHQVLKDLQKVTGRDFRKALDELNLARSSPIRMGLNRVYRNISNLDDTIDEINQAVEQIVTQEAISKLKDLKNNGPTPFLVNLLGILWHETARRYMKRRAREAASELRATESFYITDFPQIILGE